MWPDVSTNKTVPCGLSGTTSPVPSPDDPNRGFVSRLTVANPTSATKDVAVSINATTAAGFPKYLEAADYAAGSFTFRSCWRLRTLFGCRDLGLGYRAVKRPLSTSLRKGIRALK